MYTWVNLNTEGILCILFCKIPVARYWVVHQHPLESLLAKVEGVATIILKNTVCGENILFSKRVVEESNGIPTR